MVAKGYIYYTFLVISFAKLVVFAIMTFEWPLNDLIHHIIYIRVPGQCSPDFSIRTFKTTITFDGKGIFTIGKKLLVGKNLLFHVVTRGVRGLARPQIYVYIYISYIQFDVLAPSHIFKTEWDTKLSFGLLTLVLLNRSCVNLYYDISILKAFFKPSNMAILAILWISYITAAGKF